MAVKIRLMRVGKKKQPTYRVVVADSRSPRDGRFLAIIGQYAPRQEPSLVTIDSQRAVDWLKKGAQPTDQVARLFETSGVWEAFESEMGRPAKAKPKPKPKVAKKTPEKAGDTAAPEATAPEKAEASEGDSAAEATGDAEATE